MEAVTVYHGSSALIERPVFGYGNPQNDFGLGFYTTRDIELAKEWACFLEKTDGYANEYTLNMAGLRVYNIASGEYNVLNWLALLLKNRSFRISNDVADGAREYLLAEFMPPVEDADVLIGYRADDSYFSYANSFINSVLSLKQLENAMYLGNLGEQTVLVSEKAFDRLTFQTGHLAPSDTYYAKREVRDKQARQIYREQRSMKQALDAVYVLDILRQGWRNNDARLSRNVSRRRDE
jgi:hypothetical protein